MRAKPFVKQDEEKVSVEGIEFVFALLFLRSFKPVSQIVLVIIQKSFSLYEVDKHEAIQHQRGIPLPVHLVCNAFDKLQKCGVFLLEAVIKFFGYPLCIGIELVNNC